MAVFGSMAPTISRPSPSRLPGGIFAGVAPRVQRYSVIPACRTDGYNAVGTQGKLHGPGPKRIFRLFPRMCQAERFGGSGVSMGALGTRYNARCQDPSCHWS